MILIKTVFLLIVGAWPEILDEHSLSGQQSFAIENGLEQRLYIRVTQEDGHQAWSSPIYVQKR